MPHVVRTGGCSGISRRGPSGEVRMRLGRRGGREAERYSREHLEKLDVDPLNWLVRYRCPDTGRLWIRDFPHGESQSGGRPRLRQLHQDGNVQRRPVR